MTQSVVIVGNSIAAEVMHQLITNDNRYEVKAFASDSEYISVDTINGIPVVDIGNLSKKFDMSNVSLILAVGYRDLNKVRENLFNRLKSMGFTIETYVHPEAKLLSSIPVGEGSVIMPNAVIEPFVSIGTNTVVWSNCLIGHHSTLEKNCWIAASNVLAGEVTIKDNCFLGVGVVVSYKVTIQRNNIIGAGSLVSRCTKENEVYLSRSGEKHRFDSQNYAKYYLK